MVKDAAYWIAQLGLQAHPEGGYFRETYRASESITQAALPGRYRGDRSFCTGIYFLLTGRQVSRLHRLQSDELWHFHAGSPLTVYLIDGPGALSQLRMGADPEQGESWQAVIPAGTWFGAVVNDPASYSLVGCTVAPGFDFQDFELGERTALLAAFPQHRELIERLTT